VGERLRGDYIHNMYLQHCMVYVCHTVYTVQYDVLYWATRPCAVSVEECSLTVGRRGGMLDWK
jgi:hypothetical protein